MTFSFQVDVCKFQAVNKASTSFEIEKQHNKFTLELEFFEVTIYLNVLTVLTDKQIVIDRYRADETSIYFECHLTQGTFEDLMNVSADFTALLKINRPVCYAFFKSARAFSDSTMFFEKNYSEAFSSLVFAIESLANIYLPKIKSKKSRMVTFILDFVKNERFTETEIRLLEFTGNIRDTDLLFRKLLERSYIFRCNYVHDAEIVPLISQMANRLSLAFISNDQHTLYPSYSWLRRICLIALRNFISSQPSIEEIKIFDFAKYYASGTFKAKKSVEKGQPIDETSVYMQQLNDEFINQ